MSKKFYAVQIGDEHAFDYGSTVKSEALRMAHREMRRDENDGLQVRICVCTTDDDFYTEEIIVRDGVSFFYSEDDRSKFYELPPEERKEYYLLSQDERTE